MAQNLYTCPNCGVVKFQFHQYTKHLKSVHEHDLGFSVSCNFESCKSTFSKVDSFVRHVSRHHKSCGISGRGTSTVSGAVMDNDAVDGGAHDFMNVVSDDGCETASDLLSHVKANLAKFILCVRERHMLPAVVQEEITSGMQTVVTEALTGYADVVKKQLKDQDMCNDKLHDLLNVDAQLLDFGKEFQSEYRLMRYLKESGKIVLPQTMLVDKNNVQHTFQYVPVLQQLHQLLSVDEVFVHVIAGHQVNCNSMVLHDFCDGSACVSDEFFKENQTALRIHLYADEFEPCNAIGPDKGKHKITAFYYTVGNLHKKYRSQLRFIFLALLIDFKLIKMQNHDYSSFLKPLIDDLRTLQDKGIVVNVAGTSHVFKGKLVTVSADNLTAHDLAGFQRHFNSGRICRTCFIDYDNIATVVAEDDIQLRTAEMHAYHLDGVQANPNSAALYGVQKRCVFDELQDFDISRLFPHDIMHDLLEGVVPLTVRLVLHHFVSGDGQRRISVADINTAIDECELSEDNNRPNHITVESLKSHLSGSATHKLAMFFMLPRIVGRYIDLTDECDAWNVYLLLRDICDIVLSPDVARDQLLDLQDTIARFMKLFVAAFGSEKFIPKLHYMIHYPRQIEMFGPLRNLWCMRFEAKHQYFKKLADVVKSHKNLSFSLAKRHQMRVSWELMADGAVFENDVACCSKTYRFCDLPPELQLTVNHVFNHVFDRPVEDDELVASVKRRSFDSVTIVCNKVYVLELCGEEEVPVFCIVKYMICIRENWLLCCRLIVPEKFERSYHAYCVYECGGWYVVRPQQLAHHSPVDYFTLHSRNYVSLQYTLVKH